jgi:hypothetical protein
MIFKVPETAKIQKSLLTLTNATKANPQFVGQIFPLN